MKTSLARASTTANELEVLVYESGEISVRGHSDSIEELRARFMNAVGNLGLQQPRMRGPQIPGVFYGGVGSTAALSYVYLPDERRLVEIDPEQAWFWTPEWQAKEREADEDFLAG